MLRSTDAETRRDLNAGSGQGAAQQAGGGLRAGWRDGLAIVGLRGNAQDPAFCAGVARALGLSLPVRPCSSSHNAMFSVLWLGPDDWFVIGPRDQATAIMQLLRAELASVLHALTDVSSGYRVLELRGAAFRDALAQGCPLDLHPRVFKAGDCAGSHFFKAALWIWKLDDAHDAVRLVVRRSFADYFWLMLKRGSLEINVEELNNQGVDSDA